MLDLQYPQKLTRVVSPHPAANVNFGMSTVVHGRRMLVRSKNGPAYLFDGGQWHSANMQVMRWTGAAWKYTLTAATRDFAASKELDLGSSKDSAAPLGLHGQIQNPSMMGFFNGSQAIYVGDTSAVSTFSPATQFNVMKAAVRITNLEALDPQSKLVLNCTTLLSDLNSTDKGSLNARFAEWEIVSHGQTENKTKSFKVGKHKVQLQFMRKRKYAVLENKVVKLTNKGDTRTPALLKNMVCGQITESKETDANSSAGHVGCCVQKRVDNLPQGNAQEYELPLKLW